MALAPRQATRLVAVVAPRQLMRVEAAAAQEKRCATDEALGGATPACIERWLEWEASGRA